MERISFRLSFRKAIAIFAAITVAALSGCATKMGGAAQDVREAGMYSFTGWNNGTWGMDVNGEVGHPVFVQGPTADCHPSGQWQMNSRVAQGTLPPGLTLGAAPSNITGIPTERGHWIVQMETYNVECQGGSYKGFQQELRFHITGSGQVVK